MENLRKCQGKSLPRSSQGQAQVVSMFFKAGANGGVLSTQIRNTKPEARNKYKIRILKCSKHDYSKRVVRCFGHLDLGNSNLFRNWGPAWRVGSPEDQFRYSDFGFTIDMCLCGESSIRPPQGGYLQMQLTISRTVELAKEYSLPGAQNQTGAGHKYGLG